MVELRTLRSSSELAGDGAALRARLAEDGYLYFPRYLDPRELTDLRRDIMHTVANYGWTADGTDPLDGIPSEPTRYHLMETKALTERLTADGVSQEERLKLLREAYEKIQGNADWRSGYIAIQRLESFHRQAHDPRILALMRTLFGADDILVHGQRIARIVWPSAELTTTPHQDFTHIQGTADVITAWVPLSDCPSELGGLRYLLGSHRSGSIRPYESRDEEAQGLQRAQLVDAEDTNPAWATADWKLGDLVLHHSFTVHAARPNTSNRLRVSADYRYQVASDPVVINSLKPHNCPYVPDWPELLTGVSWKSYEWVNRVRHPENFDTTEYTPPSRIDQWHEDLGVTPPTHLLQRAT